jgi:hypothetical protein
MKKTLTLITLLAGAVSGYSQGEVVFNLYSGTLKLAIFGPQSVGASTYSVTYGGVTVNEEIGNTTASTELPKGNPASVYIAGSGLSGTAYDVELLAGPGGLATPGATTNGVGLTPVSAAANFRTGAATLGVMSGSQNLVFPTESYFGSGQTASIAIAAWSSAYPTLAAAVSSGVTGTWGISPVVQFGPLAVSPTPDPALPTTLQSFSLGVTTPEPSTIALGVMGASALLFRRKK